jgi:hypothetical protein
MAPEWSSDRAARQALRGEEKKNEQGGWEFGEDLFFGVWAAGVIGGRRALHEQAICTRTSSTPRSTNQ